MELVYLWVKKYKNIEKQGFNFSPRFRCEFKDEYEKYIDTDGKEKEKLKDNCELIIEKNEYKNIFPDNINITAIVGENGSGKSNLIELLTTNNNICYFIVIKTDNLYIVNNTGKKIKTDIPDNNSNKLFSKLDSDYLKFTPDNTHFYDIFHNQNKEMNENLISINKHKHNKEINRLVYKYQNIFNSFFNKNLKKLEIKQNNLSKYKIEKLPDNYIDEVSSTYISKVLYTLEKNEDLKNKDYIKQKYEELIDGNEEKYFDKNSKINLNELNEKVIEFLLLTEIQDYLEIKFYDENDICIFDFSQGERELLQQFIKIQNDLFENGNNIVMCLDEPTNTFHPNWQKEYINKLLSVFKDSSSHFITTSHSPFILSDLPKENVIFLEKGKQVYPFEDGKQTFGANIHTLLSHGFFMKDGLMGEFAKDKIQSIIKYHEELLKNELTKEENKNQRDIEKEIYEKEHKTKFRQIQSIIGDDYLKQVVKNHLVEIEKILYDEYLIDKEIKKLEDEIDRLKRLKK
ncbi:AAA family ATPase [Aliarcobacter butzleri]|uniref:AAA family ATPase n=1 Tax=Aliarcobacter butzleri TaxID=28197 RepID=UPI001EDB69B1|nr:AAA family ATPase [Aliarcobacter butzleri]MCG3692395.1 AAA family ATPase [Aliarcobacter butzleri]